MSNVIVRLVDFVTDKGNWGPDRLMQLKVEDAAYLLSLLKRVKVKPTNGWVDLEEWRALEND